MSDFDDDIAEALGECLEFAGTTAFQIDGQTFHGDFDELGDRSYTIVQGGEEISVVSHLLCTLTQFNGDVPETGRVKIGEKLFTIASYSLDSISVTFTLVDPDVGG